MSPTRPESVPAAAWWSAADHEWILGDKDPQDRLDGVVLVWRPDGILLDRRTYEHGSLAAGPRFNRDGERVDSSSASAPEQMSVEAAWALLGEAGEHLDQFRGVIARDEEEGEAEPRVVFDPGTTEHCVDHPWDIATLPMVNPELERFVERASVLDHCVYRGGHVAAGESTVSAAVAEMDGNWLGRIQSIFLPGSVVSLRREVLYVASWAATDRRTSQIYGIHQDDREYDGVNSSLAAMVVDALDLDEDEDEVVAPEHLIEGWLAAAACADGDGESASFSSYLDLLHLEPRTHWIVNLLVGKHPGIIREISLGQGLLTAATREDWVAERGQLRWPHLQAYWLMHHAVFGDHEALGEVLQQANLRYPGVAELAGVATALLAADPVEAEFWNADRVLEYRMDALQRRPDLLTDEAKTTLERDYKGIFEAEGRIESALQTLATDEENEGLVNFFNFLRSSSGKLDGYQRALAERDERDVDYIMAMQNGRVTPFEDVFINILDLSELVAKHPSREAPVLALVEAAVLRGSTSPDDHANTMPGALVALGAMSIADAPSFDAFWERVKTMAFYPEKFGPYRRLQVAVLAARHLDESESALSFLRGEVARYSGQFSDWASDTFNYADRVLTERGDPTQLEVLCARLAEGEFSGANWRESIGLVEHGLSHPSSILAPGLKIAVERGLGRHDDGDRATVVRAYARCAGPAASAILDHWLGNITDVRRDCEAAALLAGRIELDVGTDRIGQTLSQARDVLGRLESGSMKVGAALSLVRAILDHDLEGFGDRARTLLALAEDKDHGSEGLRASIAQKLSG